MLTRLAGALMRAALVILAVAAPSILIPGVDPDTRMTMALLALFVGLFTFVEYVNQYPSLVAFRDAAPFNRIRFAGLAAMLVLLPLMYPVDGEATALRQLLRALGQLVGGMLDFPYSPVRLTILMMPDNAPPALLARVGTAAAVAYLISAMMLVSFIVIMRFGGWPSRRGGFNVWINLPTFDPTAGGDVVDRLSRDALMNLISGFLLPFAIPALVKMAATAFNPLSLDDPHTLIWMMTLWAFVPASLLMRGIALTRVAQLIRAQRLRAVGKLAEERFATV